MTSHNRCIIADRQDIPLAHALLRTSPNADIWEVQILDGGLDAVTEHEYIRLISTNNDFHPTGARITRRCSDVLTLEPVERLGAGARQELRVAVRFSSFLYPVSGAWQGRCPILSHDLSCGGIAFLSAQPLERGEVVEIVVSITEQPLLLHAQILRPRPSTSHTQLYAAKFINMVAGEENMLQEAVFSQQIYNRTNRPLPPN